MEALAALLYEEQRTYSQPRWTDPDPPRGRSYLTDQRRDRWRTRARQLIQLVAPALHAHWLEQLKEELLSDAVIEAAAARFLPPRPTALLQRSVERELRRHVKAVLASIPIEEGGDGDA